MHTYMHAYIHTCSKTYPNSWKSPSLDTIPSHDRSSHRSGDISWCFFFFFFFFFFFSQNISQHVKPICCRMQLHFSIWGATCLLVIFVQRELGLEATHITDLTQHLPRLLSRLSLVDSAGQVVHIAKRVVQERTRASSDMSNAAEFRWLH